MSIEKVYEKVSLMRRQPGLSLADYIAAAQALSEEDLRAELASVRRQLAPARWNALSQSMQLDFYAKFEALRALVPT